MKYMTAAVLAAMVFATPVWAAGTASTDNPFSKESTVLDLRGLDLATVDGQQRLEIRMDQAAETVCGRGLSTIHLALGEQARDCRADVKADIRSRIATATAMKDGAPVAHLASR